MDALAVVVMVYTLLDRLKQPGKKTSKIRSLFKNDGNSISKTRGWGEIQNGDSFRECDEILLW